MVISTSLPKELIGVFPSRADCMNTTMADGAEQRLDAQIAEALFGQPGMSKMDVANRVRELRGDSDRYVRRARGGSLGTVRGDIWRNLPELSERRELGQRGIPDRG
ncbi:hypothetical protein JY409_12820 [Stenotrophomonas maltophilia]|nr:hypothetical protein [Stenotrophomonas maltophilia]